MRRTLTQIQTDYIDTVTAALLKWNHRKDGGHSRRTTRAALRRFRAEMRAWGYNESFIQTALIDAHEVLELEMNSKDPDNDF